MNKRIVFIIIGISVVLGTVLFFIRTPICSNEDLSKYKNMNEGKTFTKEEGTKEQFWQAVKESEEIMKTIIKMNKKEALEYLEKQPGVQSFSLAPDESTISYTMKYGGTSVLEYPPFCMPWPPF